MAIHIPDADPKTNGCVVIEMIAIDVRVRRADGRPDTVLRHIISLLAIVSEAGRK